MYCRLIDQPEVCHLHRWPKICKRLFSKFKRQCLKSTCEFLHVRWLPVSGALNILAPERLFKFTFNWEVEKYSPSFLYVWSFQFFHWQQVQLQLVYRFQADIADHPWNKQCLQGNGKKIKFQEVLTTVWHSSYFIEKVYLSAPPNSPYILNGFGCTLNLSALTRWWTSAWFIVVCS